MTVLFSDAKTHPFLHKTMVLSGATIFCCSKALCHTLRVKEITRSLTSGVLQPIHYKHIPSPPALHSAPMLHASGVAAGGPNGCAPFLPGPTRKRTQTCRIRGRSGRKKESLLKNQRVTGYEPLLTMVTSQV